MKCELKRRDQQLRVVMQGGFELAVVQVRLSRFLKAQNILVDMERDFIDVVVELCGRPFIGEIKATTNLTNPQ